MLRIPFPERPDWKVKAREYGFHFHTMHGEPYWDESAYYQFSLKQIENDLEDPTAKIHQMCLEVVDRVVRSEELMTRFCIPEPFWDQIATSWYEREPSLYSRIDLAYDGRGPAKFYENNADTPTSLYETGFWQWLWLEDQVNNGHISRSADQFNALQELLINRFAQLKPQMPDHTLHLACCKDTDEDRGTVQYLQDCAEQAGIRCAFVYVEDIGLSDRNRFTDLKDNNISWLFKLYPWEFMHREEYGTHISGNHCRFLEPLWKSVISNKALLPQLWKLFPDHPNLLPAYFEDDPAATNLGKYVRKPIFSREGSNISVHQNGNTLIQGDGPYGAEGYILQAWHPLPKFGDNYTLIGSWLVNDTPAGISIREDTGPITQDLSRFLPHIIV